MPYSAGTYTRTDGVYSGTTVYAQEAAANIDILAANLDAAENDIATALSTCLLKDGTQTVTANIPFAGFKITGYGTGSAPSARSDVPSYGQVQDGSPMWGGTAGGTANAITLTLAPIISAQVATGAPVWFTVGTTNTAATTIAVNGQAALACRRSQGSGLVAFVGGEFVAGGIVGVRNDGTYFQAISRLPEELKGADIASASTVNLAAATGTYVQISGTTTITGLGTLPAGAMRTLEFQGILTLTHNATSLILPGAANITTAAGDTATLRSEGAGNWRCITYTPASGRPVNATFAAYTIKTANYTAVAGDKILADCTNTAWTLTLPASPANTDSPITVKKSGANALTIGLNSKNIRLSDGTVTATNPTIDGTPGIDTNFAYVGTDAGGQTNEWSY